MKLGIVGLPNVGKSTLFNAITSAGAQAANYPFCTIEPNTGIVAVPDSRLSKLAEMFSPEKITPASCEFCDIAGLVRGASKGEGLGNKFLSHIRNCDAVLHVLRCFDDADITHVEGSCDPERDAEIINLELTLSDLEILDRRIEKTQKLLKGDKKYQSDLDLFTALKEHLNAGNPARSFDADLPPDLDLLSAKPVIYVANTDEAGLSAPNGYVLAAQALAEREKAECVAVCAQIESELAGLSDAERAEFLSELGLSEPGLSRLIRASYHLLGYISFLTAGQPEVRAWTITEGTRAPAAAGKIHSDIERGFIRAEIVAFDDLMAQGSMNAVKERGLLRSEGKEYVMKDGDVVHFRFNV